MTTANDSPLLDLLGVGFGPSNLALAVALQERGQPLRARFLEQRPHFAWHPGMLIGGATMQVSFLKDLVSLRNPQSGFSFVSYLHAKGRLSRFINRKTFFPSRAEFTDYLAWVAGQLPVCDYDRRVVAIEPIERAKGRVDRLEVISEAANGRQFRHQTRALVLAPGGRPHWPDLFQPWRHDPRVIHANDYMTQGLARLRPGMRVAVLGAGQSAAEIFRDLAGRGELAGVDLVLRSGVLRPADDSPFVNETFDPDQTARFHARPAAERQKTRQALAATNYAVADASDIAAIYDQLYEQSVAGGERLRLWRECQPVALSGSGDHIALRLEGPDGPATLNADLVILATGYRRPLDAGVLHGLAAYHEGEPPGRDYRLPLPPAWNAAVYVQGYSEETHGLSDTLLSVLALRADEIAASVLALADAARLVAAE